MGGDVSRTSWTASCPVVSAPRARLNMTADTRARFERDPNWNGGDYYETGGMRATMTELRVETLRRYGMTDEAAIRRAAAQWANVFDANSLLILGHAAEAYDVTRMHWTASACRCCMCCRAPTCCSRQSARRA